MMSARISISALVLVMSTSVATQTARAQQGATGQKTSPQDRLQAKKQTANVVTNSPGPGAKGNAQATRHDEFGLAKTVGQSSPQLTPTGGGKKGNPNNTGTTMSGIQALVSAQQSTVQNANQTAVNGAASQGPLVKKEAQVPKPLKTTATSPPANAIQATPNQPMQRKKPAAPPHVP